MANAQRVGPITDFEDAEGKKPARFKVGGYVVKCYATEYQKSEPHPVLVRIRAMSMGEAAGKNWLVGVYEKRDEYTDQSNTARIARSVMAETIVEAAEGAKSTFTMDKNGNPLTSPGEGTQNGLTTNGAASAPSGVDVALYAAAVLASKGPVTDEGIAQVAHWMRALKTLSEDFARGGIPPTESSAESEEPAWP